MVKKTKSTTWTEWDPAEYLTSKEAILAYLEVAITENDTKFLVSAIGDIARSEGMTEIAKELDVGRESLYKTLSIGGNPSFKTIVKVLDIFGFQLKLKIKPKPKLKKTPVKTVPA